LPFKFTLDESNGNIKMNFEEAISYSKKNNSLLESDGIQVVGVAYLPNDKHDKFQIFTVEYNLECTQEEGNDWFDVSWNGDPEWGGDLPALIANIPEPAKSLNYQPLKADSFMMLEVWYILKVIFPELPDQGSTEFISDNEFEKRASALVNKLNRNINDHY
jgi:hypothetical protein